MNESRAAAAAEPYGADLAAIHDAGFLHLATHAADALLAALRRAGHGPGLVVDLGCGSGATAARLADAGYEVVGVDLSAHLLALARQRVPRATFRHGSLYDTPLPRCVAVTAIGECLNYLFDARGTARQRLALLRRIHAALAPGGLLLCDVRAPSAPGTPARQHTFTEGDGWAVLVDAREDRRRRLLTRSITTFRRTGGAYRRDSEVHHLRLVPPAIIRHQMRRAGFAVRTLRRYGTLRLPPTLHAFQAQRP